MTSTEYTIVVPAAKWFEKDQDEGSGDAGEGRDRETWDADPTSAAREATGRLDKENTAHAIGRKQANLKEPTAQSKGKEHQLEGTSHRAPTNVKRGRAERRLRSSPPQSTVQVEQRSEGRVPQAVFLSSFKFRNIPDTS